MFNRLKLSLRSAERYFKNFGSLLMWSHGKRQIKVNLSHINMISFHHIRLYAEMIDKLHALYFNGLLYTVMFLEAPGISAVQKQRKNIKDKQKILQVWVTHFTQLNEHCFYCKESLWIKIWSFFILFYFLIFFSTDSVTTLYFQRIFTLPYFRMSFISDTDKGNISVHHIFFSAILTIRNGITSFFFFSFGL